MTKEEIIKQQIKAHEDWLMHPVTQDYLKILKKRETKYREALFSKVLKETDEPYEDRHRAAINTAQAIINILCTSTLFVEQQNNNTVE